MTEWRDVTLGHVCELKRGYDLPRGRRKVGNVPIISSSGPTGFHSEAMVPAPGVVTGQYGTLGEVFYITEDFWPLNTSLYVRDFKGNDPRWVAALLESMNLAQHDGAAAVPGLNRNQLHGLPVRVPDLATQEIISVILGALRDLIENNRRRVVVLEEMARAIYREWFVHFRYPGHDNAALVESSLGPIPHDWRADRLDHIAEVNRASRTPAREDTIKYLDISVLGDGSVGELTAMTGANAPGRARRVVSAGDVVWSMVRPNRRAHALLVDPEPNWIASTGLTVLTPTAVSSALLYEAVSTREFSDYLTSQEGGAAYPAVKPKDFEAAITLVPTPELDGKFDDVVGCQHKLVWRLRAQSAQLARTRDLLLPKLLTGTIDVSSIDLGALVADSVA